MKYWEIITNNLSKAGWSWGCVSTINSNGQPTFIADAHRDDGKRFIVRAEEKLTPFLELESAVRVVIGGESRKVSRTCRAIPDISCLTSRLRFFQTRRRFYTDSNQAEAVWAARVLRLFRNTRLATE